MKRRISTTSSQRWEIRCAGSGKRGTSSAGNTKTHGIVRGEVPIREDLPAHMRRGIFAQPRTYRAWVRFSGPGPYITPDIDNVGFMSMSIKLMGVPGPKLLDDEKFTQDMFGVSTPTFVTPDTKANSQLPHWSYKNAQIFHFPASTCQCVRRVLVVVSIAVHLPDSAPATCSCRSFSIMGSISDERHVFTFVPLPFPVNLCRESTISRGRCSRHSCSRKG